MSDELTKRRKVFIECLGLLKKLGLNEQKDVVKSLDIFINHKFKE